MAYHAENAKELDLLVTTQQAYEFVEASIDTLRFWKAHVIKAYINPDTGHPGPTPVDPTQGAVELEIPTQELARIIETALGLQAAAQWDKGQYAAAVNAPRAVRRLQIKSSRMLPIKERAMRNVRLRRCRDEAS